MAANLAASPHLFCLFAFFSLEQVAESGKSLTSPPRSFTTPGQVIRCENRELFNSNLRYSPPYLTDIYNFQPQRLFYDFSVDFFWPPTFTTLTDVRHFSRFIYFRSSAVVRNVLKSADHIATVFSPILAAMMSVYIRQFPLTCAPISTGRTFARTKQWDSGKR